MALHPETILAYKGIEVPNPLTQLTQATQLEMNQMQLQELKNDRLEMQKFQQELAAKGGNIDLNSYADMLLKSPKHAQLGIELKQKLKDQALYDQYLQSQGVNVAGPAPVNAMAAQPIVQPTAPANAMATQPVGPAPVNAMVAQPTPVSAPAPVNAMVANEQQILNNIRMLSASNDPRAKAEVDVLKNQLNEIRKIPTEVREYQYAQANPEFEKYQMRMKRAGASNIYNVQEKAEQGARGKMLVDQYTDISKAAANAAKTLPSVESNLGILNKGFDTGFGTEAKTAGAKVLASLGVQDAEKYATNSQAFLANASQAVLQKQLEQKGPQTEPDAQRITQTGAQLGNTKAANEFVLQVAKAQLKRDIDQRNFYDNWYKNNKTYDGAESAWYAGQGSASLFDRPELKKYRVEAQAQPATEVKDNRQSLGSIFGGKKP